MFCTYIWFGPLCEVWMCAFDVRMPQAYGIFSNCFFGLCVNVVSIERKIRFSDMKWCQMWSFPLCPRTRLPSSSSLSVSDFHTWNSSSWWYFSMLFSNAMCVCERESEIFCSRFFFSTETWTNVLTVRICFRESVSRIGIKTLQCNTFTKGRNVCVCFATIITESWYVTMFCIFQVPMYAIRIFGTCAQSSNPTVRRNACACSHAQFKRQTLVNAPEWICTCVAFC